MVRLYSSLNYIGDESFLKLMLDSGEVLNVILVVSESNLGYSLLVVRLLCTYRPLSVKLVKFLQTNPYSW